MCSCFIRVWKKKEAEALYSCHFHSIVFGGFNELTANITHTPTAEMDSHSIEYGWSEVTKTLLLSLYDSDDIKRVYSEHGRKINSKMIYRITIENYNKFRLCMQFHACKCGFEIDSVGHKL